MDSADCRMCVGAPNLSLDLNPTHQPRCASSLGHDSYAAIGKSQRPQSAVYGKNHNFVQKDFYRHMKTDKIVSKHLEKK